MAGAVGLGDGERQAATKSAEGSQMIHLGDWTAYWARRTPDAEAVVEPHRRRRWSYRELDGRANRLARALQRDGVKKGDRVALLAHNRAEHFELFFACAKLGALFAPLNWRLAAPEIDAVLADAGPSLLFYDAECSSLVAALTSTVDRVALDPPSAGGRPWETLLASVSDDALASNDDAFAPNSVSLEDPIMICYTSGTTGRPKGALLSHRQLVFNALSTDQAVGLSSCDSTLVFMPLFHTGGLNCLATPLLHYGGRVVVMPGFDAERALELAESERITLHMGVPTIFQMLAQSPSFARRDLSSARMALCGGAPCPLELIEAYRARGVLFRQGYGLTEVGPNCFSLTEDDAFRKAGSVGWPNFYLRARIVDDAGREVAAGEDGELALAGPMVTLGYFRNPQATADAFRGTEWFHTGDLARRDEEGYHFIVGRKKDMFISGGENVYPAEVELALAGAPGVQEACVIGVADARWGEVGRAVVVAAAGVTPDPASILMHLHHKLAKYKVPKSVVFTDALPRNPGGKILRHVVKERFGHEGG
jgi:fatty-acyl-CoA synthase